MPRLVALLRAINVGGHVVTMERLRALFAGQGFTRIDSYIASGNVLFDAPAGEASALERGIESHLHAALGYKVDAFIRTPAELAAVAALEPFAADAGAARTLYVAFLREPPPPAYVERLMSFRSPTDDFRVVGRESYWSCAGRMSDSRYFRARPDRVVTSTTRNMTTVRKLAALANH